MPMLNEYRYVSFANPNHSLKGPEVPSIGMPDVLVPFEIVVTTIYPAGAEPTISDEDSSRIWTWRDDEGLQLIKVSACLHY